jgi:hypothetical protein
MSDELEDRYLRGRRDVIAALLLLATCGIGLWSLWTNPYIDPAYYRPDPGPGFLPVLVIGLLAFTAVLLAVSGVRRMRSARERKTPVFTAKLASEFAYPAAMIASLIILFFAIPEAGFLPAAIPFAFVWCAAIAWQDGFRPTPWRVGRFAVEAALIALIVHTVFVRLIGVPLR